MESQADFLPNAPLMPRLYFPFPSKIVSQWVTQIKFKIDEPSPPLRANTALSSLFSCALGEKERECRISPEWWTGFVYFKLNLGHPLPAAESDKLHICKALFSRDSNPVPHKKSR